MYTVQGVFLFLGVKMKYSKPFKTVEEQIAYLKSFHHLKIQDESAARYALMNYSYYDLINGYKNIFMVNDVFTSNITIEYLTDFLWTDKEIQNVLFKYSSYVESRFKNIFAYYLSMEFGVNQEDYLNKQNYTYETRSDNDRDIFIKNMERIKSYLKKPLKELNDPTRHYICNHNHVPAWILFKNISFNACTQLFRFSNYMIKRKTINEMLDKHVEEDYKNQFFVNSLIIIRKYRNAIAHNLNFVSSRMKQYKISFSKLDNDNLITGLDNIKYYDSPFAMIVCLSYLLDPMTRKKFLLDLKSVLNTIRKRYGPDILKDYCKIADIPEDILHRLED